MAYLSQAKYLQVNSNKMAKNIKTNIPTLEGKDAERFMENMRKVDEENNINRIMKEHGFHHENDRPPVVKQMMKQYANEEVEKAIKEIYDSNPPLTNNSQ